MSKALLEVKDLHVRVEEKEILHGVNLTVGQDETHVLMGPNGTGKYAGLRHYRQSGLQRHRRLHTV